MLVVLKISCPVLKSGDEYTSLFAAWRLCVRKHFQCRSEAKALRDQRSQRRRVKLACGLDGKGLPVCFVESQAETGRSVHLIVEGKGAKRAKNSTGGHLVTLEIERSLRCQAIQEGLNADFGDFGVLFARAAADSYRPDHLPVNNDGHATLQRRQFAATGLRGVLEAQTEQ